MLGGASLALVQWHSARPRARGFMRRGTKLDEGPRATICAIKHCVQAANDKGLQMEAFEIKHLRRLILVGSERFELSTYGLRVRCSTS